MSTARLLNSLFDGVIGGTAAIGVKSVVCRGIEYSLQQCILEPFSPVSLNIIVGAAAVVCFAALSYQKDIGVFSSTKRYYDEDEDEEEESHTYQIEPAPRMRT